ncbi:hypothetical protein PGB90_002042 [Kerria lacca]
MNLIILNTFIGSSKTNKIFIEKPSIWLTSVRLACTIFYSISTVSVFISLGL